MVHGIDTNRDLLVSILREPRFVAGAIDTGWLERTVIEIAGSDPDVALSHAAVASLALAAWNRDGAAVLGFAPSGWRNVRSSDQSLLLGWEDDVLEVIYDLSRSIPRISVDGVPINVTAVYAVHPDRVDITIGRLRRSYAIEIDTGRIFVDSSAGSSLFAVVPRFSPHGSEVPDESLVAPTPGKVVSILVSVGDRVTRGESLVVIEAMKMEQSISAPDDGIVISIPHAVGVQVEAGDVLVEIGEDGDD